MKVKHVTNWTEKTRPLYMPDSETDTSSDEDEIESEAFEHGKTHHEGNA